MKLKHVLLALGASLFFVGCQSTENAYSNAYDKAPEAAPVASTQKQYDYKPAAPAPRSGSGLLMDRYKSGSIPGLQEK